MRSEYAMPGIVTEVLRGALGVKLANGHMVRARLSGRLITNKIKVVAGDAVMVELTPYDLAKGRITRRLSVSFVGP
jgi:translation initiation factor IF-1